MPTPRPDPRDDISEIRWLRSPAGRKGISRQRAYEMLGEEPPSPEPPRSPLERRARGGKWKKVGFADGGDVERQRGLATLKQYMTKGWPALRQADDKLRAREISDAVPRRRADDEYKSGGRKWMATAVKHPGALHRQLGVPQGQKIPASKIAKAAHSSNPTLAKRARLAQTFAKFRPH